ncbi:MAG: (d)CMP kinase [Brevinematales bacterium]|nr:(d)CMP kinase [Brevinematales bacterium]
MQDVITIDGPVGVGKSTVAKALARKLGYTYLDTGAMYRAFSLKLLRNGISTDDIEGILQLINSTFIDFDGEKVFLDGEDVSSLIRSKEVEKIVSKVASISQVRKFIVSLQRNMSKKGKVVMEGRDCGTVVAPDARYKFYLDASLEERASRRLRDEKYSNRNVSIEDVKREIELRDRIDSTREDSPLRVPDGAIVINTDNMSIEEVVAELVKYIDKF